jgi:hypothetical protein
MKHKQQNKDTFHQSDKFLNHKLSKKNTHEGLHLEGYWTHRLFAPIGVTDVGKFKDLFSSQLFGGEYNRFKTTHKITDKTLRRLIVHNKNNRSDLRNLERLLYGGGQKWVEEYENIVVNEGLDHVLDVILSGGTQDTTWFVGLLAATPSPLATWTATQIASNDFVAYDESTLQAFTDGGVSGQSLSNSASPATFTISTNSSSIGGAYLIGTNAKSTPAGTLYSAGAFSGGNKAADDNDTLEVTCTFTSADDGV